MRGSENVGVQSSDGTSWGPNTLSSSGEIQQQTEAQDFVLGRLSL